MFRRVTNKSSRGDHCRGRVRNFAEAAAFSILRPNLPRIREAVNIVRKSFESPDSLVGMYLSKFVRIAELR